MVGGGAIAVGDSATAALVNNKMILIDTGANINSATTYAGQLAYCTATGNGFTLDVLYERNTANTGWFVKGFPWLGNGSDGSVTISANTDLGSSNNKNYLSLTINNGIILQGNTGLVIRVMQTLTFGNASSQILVDGKGAVGGTSVAGNGGGMVKVVCYAISGTGLITSNGTNGTFNAGVTATTTGGVATVYNNNVTGSGGGGTPGGGAGGGFGGAGGSGDNASVAGVAISLTTVTTLYTFLTQFGIYGSGGGGSSGGVGGGGSGGLVLVYCETAIPAIALQANGGNATTNGSTTKGGGGGGGLIITMTRSTDSSTKSVTGGTATSPAVNGSAGVTISIPI